MIEARGLVEHHHHLARLAGGDRGEHRRVDRRDRLDVGEHRRSRGRGRLQRDRRRVGAAGHAVDDQSGRCVQLTVDRVQPGLERVRVRREHHHRQPPAAEHVGELVEDAQRRLGHARPAGPVGLQEGGPLGALERGRAPRVEPSHEQLADDLVDRPGHARFVPYERPKRGWRFRLRLASVPRTAASRPRCRAGRSACARRGRRRRAGRPGSARRSRTRARRGPCRRGSWWCRGRTSRRGHRRRRGAAAVSDSSSSVSTSHARW